MANKLFTLIAGICIASAVQAADIYRWVDDAGRTHVADKVPERYRNAAEKVDTSPSKLTPRQRSDAEARAAGNARQAEAAGRAPAAAVIDPAPAAASDTATECARLRRLYRESQECFAPYQRGDAGPRPEAYQVCKEVKDPGAACTDRDY